jgi:nicotinamidase-related amidase
MTKRVWDAFLTVRDRAHLASSEPSQRWGFGERAAVLSVDNYRKAIGDAPEPLLDAIAAWPSSTGLEGWGALESVSVLLTAARAAGVPVIHVAGEAPKAAEIAGWREGMGGRHATQSDDAAAQDRLDRGYDFVDQARPMPGEVVMRKTAPSAFFGTPLIAHLVDLRIDTLIVCGEAVSGCIRASVVDGRSHRFRIIVPEECVYDRHEATWALNLFDMHEKYADVLPLDEVLSWLSRGQST